MSSRDVVGARARGRVTHFVENGAAFHGHQPQLFTPMQLNRYGGNKRDPDPKYDPNCTASNCDTRKITDVMTNVLMHLDYGLLSFGYDGLFEKDQRPTCYSSMFPITPIEIGHGFVVGTERVVRHGSSIPHIPHLYSLHCMRKV